MVSIFRGVTAIAKNGPQARKIHSCWFPDVAEVDGRQYARITVGDHRFRAFVDNNTAMHDLMVKRRNAAIDVALMEKFGAAEDPDATRCLPKRKRGEMTDELPNVLTAEVKTSEGHEYDFRFLVVSADHHRLSIELTNENMELLQAEPMLDDATEDDSAVSFQPTITHEHVKWNGKRSSVYCTYSDSDKRRRTKNFPVVPCMDPKEFQGEVDRMAQMTADFYTANHAQPPVMQAIQQPHAHTQAIQPDSGSRPPR